jgi:hypothetical protein
VAGTELKGETAGGWPDEKLRVGTDGFEVVRTDQLGPADGRRMSGPPALSSPVGSTAGLDRDKQKAASHGPSHAMHGYA